MNQFELSSEEVLRRKTLAENTRKMVSGVLEIVSQDETSIMTTYRDFFLQISFSDLHPLMVFGLAKPIDNTKDDIFILTEDEVKNLLKDDYYDKLPRYGYEKCAYCCWTRTKDGTKVRTGYASRCWCSREPNYREYSVRPAMYIKMK